MSDTPQPQHRADTLAETVREGLDWVEYRCPVSVSKDAYAALSELVALAESAGLELDVARQEHERAERAEAELDEAIGEMNAWHERATELLAETERLRADLVRMAEKKDRWQRESHGLREALREIARQAPAGTAARAVQAARDALAGGQAEKCEICGNPGDLQARGWHDDGDPMLTCAECEPPGGQADKEPTT